MSDVGVYFHLPFCERVCPYCDFAVVAGHPGAREARTLAALEAELGARAADFPALPLASIYFGGGTPSLFQARSIARLLEAASRAFAGAPREVTLELNPGSSERARLPAFFEAGVTRLSVGVQSFDDQVLQRLGRAHRARACHATLEAARQAGFERLSVDLIFGVPGQSTALALDDVAAALDHGIEHISAYALSAPAGTALAAAVKKGLVRMPEQDLLADMMLAIAAKLEAAGFARYELSSYAKPGHEALHNARTWQRRPVLGVGMGAHSYLPPALAPPSGARPANERDYEAWCARIERGDFQPPQPALLDRRAARAEAAFLALRTREGLCADAFAHEFGAAPRAFYASAIERAIAADTLRENERGDLTLTTRGWLLADAVFEGFV